MCMCELPLSKLTGKGTMLSMRQEALQSDGVQRNQKYPAAARMLTPLGSLERSAMFEEQRFAGHCCQMTAL